MKHPPGRSLVKGQSGRFRASLFDIWWIFTVFLHVVKVGRLIIEFILLAGLKVSCQLIKGSFCSLPFFRTRVLKDDDVTKGALAGADSAL